MSHSAQGYESFDTEDLSVIDWLKDQLLKRLNSAEGVTLGADCYHLKGQGGIKKALGDLTNLLASQRYRYVIRSDAKGYYAHIRHHKLIGLLKDNSFSREVCHVTTQLCQRMTVRRGLYSECTQGIPLGCAASPALAAIYLSPLDNAIRKIPGVKYLRYMDDWVILCPNKWKMRRAVKVMHQTLKSLGLHVHPDKTFIGKVERGFDFLGVQFHRTQQSMSQVSLRRLNEQLNKKFSTAAQLYEQGRLQSLKSIELYLTHWLRWVKGIGVATSTALDAILQLIRPLCQASADVMIATFAHSIMRWIEKQNTIQKNELSNKKHGETCTTLCGSIGVSIKQSSCGYSLL